MSPLRTYNRLEMPGIEPTRQETTPAVVFSSQQVKQLPLVLFGGDLVVGASADVIYDASALMSSKCSGFVLVGIVGTVRYSVNGGAFRTAGGIVQVNEADIRQIRIQTAVLSGCILQLHGV